MEFFKPTITMVISSLVFITQCLVTSIPLNETFTQCLINRSSSSEPIESLIFAPNNSSYSLVLKQYIRNLRFNTSTTSKPILIVAALYVSHVQASVFCGRTHGVLMKIRSGGHDYEGVSYVSYNIGPFFILDMFNLRSIDIDISTGTAWVQTGATLGEVYYSINEKNKTWGFSAGVCPTVGVGGHLGGGGYGNMMRKYGLSIDNIIDAEIVDVRGKLLNRKCMGEDLFWVICGGGGSSFGVVIAYRINVVYVPETVTVFLVRRTLEQNATDLVYKWEQVAPNLDDDLFIRLTIDVVSGTQYGRKTVRASFITLFLGDSSRLVDIMKESFPELGLVQADCIEMGWLESINFWTSFPIGTPISVLRSRIPQVLTHLKRKSDYVNQIIAKEDLQGIWNKMIELGRPTMTFNPYGGKMAQIPSSETPFPHRAGRLCKIQYATNWVEDGSEDAIMYLDLTRQLYDYMTPFVSKDPREAFLCYRDLDLGINNHGKGSSYQGLSYGIKYFQENYNRLVQIKTKFDPDNFFRNEQSVPTLHKQRDGSMAESELLCVHHSLWF